MDIGDRIKELRKMKKMTAKELAEKAEISAVYLSYVETGNKKPGLDTLQKICSVFEINLTEFFHCDTPLTPELKELLENAKDLTLKQLEALILVAKNFNN